MYYSWVPFINFPLLLRSFTFSSLSPPSHFHNTPSPRPFFFLVYLINVAPLLPLSTNIILITAFITTWVAYYISSIFLKSWSWWHCLRLITLLIQTSRSHGSKLDKRESLLKQNKQQDKINLWKYPPKLGCFVSKGNAIFW